METGQTFEGLPSWARGAIAVGGAAASGWLGWKIYSGVKKRLSLQKARAEQNETQKEIEKLKKQGSPPTITKAQFSIMANQLETAFDGYGTDEETVFRVFDSLKNDADVLMLIKTYGIRTISTGRFNPTVDKAQTLGQILSEELSDTTFNPSKALLGLPGLVWAVTDVVKGKTDMQVLNKMLKNKKIKYQF